MSIYLYSTRPYWNYRKFQKVHLFLQRKMLEKRCKSQTLTKLHGKWFPCEQKCGKISYSLNCVQLPGINISSVNILLSFPPYIFRYKSMLPVLEMASVHNVELVKFFFKLLYQADTRRADAKGMYLISYNLYLQIYYSLIFQHLFKPKI